MKKASLKFLLPLLLLMLTLSAEIAGACSSICRRRNPPAFCEMTCRSKSRTKVSLKPNVRIVAAKAPEYATQIDPLMRNITKINQPVKKQKKESLAILSDQDMLTFDVDSLEYDMIVIKGVSSVSPLEGLRTFPGKMKILNSPNLTSLAGLGALVSIGGLTIKENDALTDINTLSQVEVIEGDLNIEKIANISSVSFPNLREIQGDLRIEQNGDLSSLYMPKLEAISGSLSIRDNKALTYFDFPSLNTIGGTFYLQANPDLENFDCPYLQTIGKDLLVQENTNLYYLSGLSGANIGRDLIVSLNDNLMDLPAGSIGRDAIVKYNENIDGASGLGIAMGGSFFFEP